MYMVCVITQEAVKPGKQRKPKKDLISVRVCACVCLLKSIAMGREEFFKPGCLKVFSALENTRTEEENISSTDKKIGK